MWPNSRSKKWEQGQVDETRRATRFPVAAMLTCPLGDVVDLSTTGMRVRSDKKPPVRKGQTLEMVLRSGNRQLRIRGEIVWIRKAGRDGFDTGLRFGTLSPSVESALGALAQLGYIPAKDENRPKTGAKIDIQAKMRLPDYYRILGVARTASTDEIRHAYRDLARRYHPDVSEAKNAEEHFKRINESYRTLNNQKQREAYDRSIDKSSA